MPSSSLWIRNWQMSPYSEPPSTRPWSHAQPRNHPNIPCVKRIIDRKIARVVVGMLDPDPRITGRGMLALRNANIAIDLFLADLKLRRHPILVKDFLNFRPTLLIGFDDLIGYPQRLRK